MICITDYIDGDAHIINMRRVSHVRVHNNQDDTVDLIFYSTGALLCVIKYAKKDLDALIDGMGRDAT